MFVTDSFPKACTCVTGAAYSSQRQLRKSEAQPLPSSRLGSFPRKKGFIMNQAYYALATMQAAINNRLDSDRERGATAVEYGLMVGLIAVVIIAAVVILGDQLDFAFSTVTDELGGSMDNAPAGAGAGA